MLTGIFSDDHIRKICPENHPIPLNKIGVLIDRQRQPNYLANGYTGIRYVRPRVHLPATVNAMAVSMARNRGGHDVEVRKQIDVVQTFVEQHEAEESKAEELLEPLTPEGKGEGGGSVASKESFPSSVNSKTKGRGLRGSKLNFAAEEDEYAEQPSRRNVQLEQDVSKLTPLGRTRKPRSDKEKEREATAEESMPSPPETRAKKKQRLRGEL